MTGPALCADHRPVISAMAEKVHTGDEDVANATAMFARCCLACIPLQTPPQPSQPSPASTPTSASRAA